MEIPDHFSFVTLEAFVVMPNHTHGIIIIDKPDDYCNDAAAEIEHALSLRPLNSSESSEQPNQQLAQPHLRFRNPGKNTVSSMFGSCKSAVTWWCNQNNLSFGWQTRFHDHIIRDNGEFERIKIYY